MGNKLNNELVKTIDLKIQEPMSAQKRKKRDSDVNSCPRSYRRNGNSPLNRSCLQLSHIKETDELLSEFKKSKFNDNSKISNNDVQKNEYGESMYENKKVN